MIKEGKKKNNIYISLARSFDDSSVKDDVSKGVHLVSSSYICDTDLLEYSILDNKISINLAQKIVIIKIVHIDQGLNIKLNSDSLRIENRINYNLIYKGNYLDVYEVNLLEFFYKYENNDEYLLSVLGSLIGAPNDTSKRLFDDAFLSKTIFHFENFSWFTILILFKLFNIKISGGSNNKRHILSSVEFNLSIFLYMNEITDIKSIYASFKNPDLQINSKLDTNYYYPNIEDQDSDLYSNTNYKYTKNLVLINKNILSLYLTGRMMYELYIIDNNEKNSRDNIKDKNDAISRYNLELSNINSNNLSD